VTGRRSRRGPVALTAAGLGACAIVAGAQAAITPRFSQAAARPGAIVTVYQPHGLGWLPRRRGPLRVYLVSARIAGSATQLPGGRPRHGPPPRTAVYVGRLSLPGGRLRFRVPGVPAGRYAAVVWCTPCGGTLLSSSGDVRPEVEVPPDGTLLRVLR
jgi:hypothetical protein